MGLGCAASQFRDQQAHLTCYRELQRVRLMCILPTHCLTSAYYLTPQPRTQVG